MQGMKVTAGMRPANPTLGMCSTSFSWLPQTARRAGRTLRLAVFQCYILHSLIKIDNISQRTLDAEDIDCIDCVLCHGKPKEPGHGKRKHAGQDHVVHPDTADVGKVYLWRFYNLSRMA